MDAQLTGWAEACERVGLTGLHFHDCAPKCGLEYDEGWRSGQDRDGDLRAQDPCSFDRYNIIDDDDIEEAAKMVSDYLDRG